MITFIFIAIIYGIVEMFKIFFKSKYKHYIPLFALGIGVVFALITCIFSPDILPSQNVFDCIVFGLFCGLSAIGWNQILKHFEIELSARKYASENKEIKEKGKNEVITLKEIDFNKINQGIENNSTQCNLNQTNANLSKANQCNTIQSNSNLCNTNLINEISENKTNQNNKDHPN